MKRRAKEVFESTDRTKEHAYVIFPGEEMTQVTLEGSNSDREAKFDFNKIKQLYEARKKTYVTAHEHPMKTEEHISYLTVPSIQDIRGFLLDDFARMEVVAQRNSETGKIEGYFCFRKTKATPAVGYSPMYKDKIDRSNPELREKAREIAQATSRYDHLVKQNKIREGIEVLAQQFRLRYKFIPAEGYKIDERLTNFYHPEERAEIERKTREEFRRRLRKQGGGLDLLLSKYHQIYSTSLLILGSISLIISFFFLGSSITGNVIGSSNQSSMSIIFFIIGLIIIYYYFNFKSKPKSFSKYSC